MDVRTRFRARSSEVATYLSALAEIERTTRSPERGSFAAGAAVSASRAAAFIMMYNCIEDAVRHAFATIRREIQTSACSYEKLKSHWQDEIVRAHFEQKLRQGSSNDTILRDIAQFVPGSIDWKDRSDRLPFVGNVDNVRILRAIDRMELSWRPPSGTLGGADLTVIREQRNALAHGFETFETVGSQFDTSDLTAKLERSILFVDSLLEALQDYRDGRGFERQAPGTSSRSQ